MTFHRHLAVGQVIGFLAVMMSTTVFAGSYVQVPMVAGSTATNVFAISDNGTMTGSYSTLADFSDEHGFVGTMDGKYTTFDFPGAITSEPRGLNTSGDIVGIDSSTLTSFQRDKKGTAVVIKKAGTPVVGIVQTINSSGQFVGDYVSGGTPNRAGYYGKNGAYIADITLPFATLRTSPRGVNASGAVSGFYFDLSGNTHGFLLRNGAVTVIDFPGSTATNPEGINDKGQISGAWTDGSGLLHGFLLSADLTTWTQLDAPGATASQAWGINGAGQVAVNNVDGAGVPYIYCSGSGNAHNVCSGSGNGKPSASVSASLSSVSASAEKVTRVSPSSYRQFKCSGNCIVDASQSNWPALVQQQVKPSARSGRPPRINP